MPRLSSFATTSQRINRRVNIESFVPSSYGVTGYASTGHGIYSFTSTATTITIPYTFSTARTMYILAVGGGGGGSYDNAGGGGAGGVVQATITIPAGSDTITINIGAGQTASTTTNGGTGGTTTLSFGTNTGLNIIAGGGGGGCTYGSTAKSTAGSSSGGSGSGTNMSSGGSGVIALGNTSNNNSANSGGAGTGAIDNNSGGGGAGTAGKSGSIATAGYYGNGGDGIQCTLTGIKSFGSYGTYYWGGGGGGAAYTRVGGSGGKGGGGGGNYCSSTSTGTGATATGGGLGDTSGINPSNNGQDYTVSSNRGNAGANTGGGGGGGGNNSTNHMGGSGGSGIVVIALSLPTASAFQTLMVAKVPWGQYSAASWVSGTNTLTDLTGNGRHATTTNLTSGIVAGNGATASIPYIGGSTTSTILWPAGSIPATFTIASITRYATTGTRGRILNGSSVNYLQGHWSGGRGLFFNEGFRQGTSYGTVTDWVNMVGTNSTTVAIPNNVLVDGVARATANGGIGGSGTLPDLRINGTGINSEASDFQFSQLLIWNQALTPSEMVTVANALTNYLSTGVLQ